MNRTKRTPFPAAVIAVAKPAPVYSPQNRIVPPVNLRVIAEGLRFPEGPVVMADGSVLVVEIEGQTLARCHPDGSVEVVAEIPGGPNGAAIGPDGACYVTNNGGIHFNRTAEGMLLPHGAPSSYAGGGIDRIDLKTGEVKRLYDSCNGHKLRGPNDLVFDENGGFWFTDAGKSQDREMLRGGVYYARIDGSLITEAVFPMLTPNGCGLSPDGKTLYVAETVPGRLVAFDIIGEGKVAPSSGWSAGRLVGAPGGNTLFDSLAVEAGGAIVIATVTRGGLTRIAADGGTVEHIPLDDIFTTNVAFGGPGMKTAYVTMSAGGRLVALDWPEPGLVLNYNG